MLTSDLPTFRLEAHFSRWEFVSRHHMTASDPETMTISELLSYGTPDDRAAFLELPLGYIPTWGGDELRAAIAATYDGLSADQVLAFSGAQEAMYLVLQRLLAPGDHAIVTVPNYQSMEAVPVATGATVSGLPLWHGKGGELRWTLDLDRLRSLLRPETRVVAVNFPNNPTGFVPPVDDFRALARLCEERGIVLLSDEVYRGVELDRSRTLPHAASISPTAISINVLSKAYGLPGLRIGWLASQNTELLGELERSKHYTTICNSAPSEFLATVALRNASRLRDRIRGIVAENLPLFDEFFADHTEFFDWEPPVGGCVAFPRYAGSEGVEKFCRSLVEERGVLLLPASLYESGIATVPDDRFRIGIGRRDPGPGLAELRAFLGPRT